MIYKKSPGVDRREFMKGVFSCGAFFGFGCSCLLAKDNISSIQVSGRNQKFSIPSGYTYEQVLNFAFKNWYIPIMKSLQETLERDKFLNFLQSASYNSYYKRNKRNFRKIKSKTVRSLIENFWEPMKKSRLWGTCINTEILQKTDRKGVVRMTECLVAKIFRENDAADIGYAGICHADFAVAEAFNPRIKLVRNQCLMKGDKCCLFEYSLGYKIN